MSGVDPLAALSVGPIQEARESCWLSGLFGGRCALGVVGADVDGGGMGPTRVSPLPVEWP
jgi:hypothetical protein